MGTGAVTLVISQRVAYPNETDSGETIVIATSPHDNGHLL